MDTRRPCYGSQASPMTYGPIGRINYEWGKVHADRNLQISHLALTGSEALRYLQLSPSTERDTRLRTFITEANAGSQDAKRVILQAFLPSLIRTSRVKGLRWASQEEAQGIAVEAFFIVLAAFPDHLSTSVSGNLMLRVLNRVTSWYPASAPVDRRLAEHWQSGTFAVEHSSAYRSEHDVEDSTDLSSLGQEQQLLLVMKVLDWGLKNGAITEADSKLLGRYTVESPEEKKASAKALGMTIDQLHHRAWRIREKLRNAVVGHNLEWSAL